MTIEIIDDEIKLYLNEGQPGAVTEDGIQTLTNKTINAADNTIVGLQPYAANLTSWAALAPSSKVDATGGTASGLTLNGGYTEGSFTVTGTTPALSPTNGTYQSWTLTANSTPTAGTWANGQDMVLHIDDGTNFVVSSWAALSITWKTDGGLPPTLLTTGVTVIELWKHAGVLYGARVGNA